MVRKSELKSSGPRLFPDWQGLKSAISSQAWAHQAASVSTKLNIYPGPLSFELQHNLC